MFYNYIASDALSTSQRRDKNCNSLSLIICDSPREIQAYGGGH